MMNAIPPVVPAREVDPTGKYRCPLCKVQSTGDEADTGWVECPMLRGKMICLGSCIEHQAVARSDDFERHFDRALFDELSSSAQRSVAELRQVCLVHQLEVIDERFCEHSEDEAALQFLRAVVEQRAQDVEEE